MDARLTLNNTETFMELIEWNHRHHARSSFLVDNEGIERVEGYIKSIHLNMAIPCLELEDGIKINIQNIIAVNGVFLPLYTEC